MHKVPHGQAVAIGMVEEARFAVREGFLDDQSLQSLISILLMFGLPTSIPADVNVKEFEDVILQDKKMRQGQLLLPILIELGRTELKTVDGPHNLILQKGGE
jgi:3-dehydroquinate synthase